MPLRKDRAGLGPGFVRRLVLQVKLIVRAALTNRIIHIRAGHLDPGILFVIFCLQRRKIDRILHPIIHRRPLRGRGRGDRGRLRLRFKHRIKIDTGIDRAADQQQHAQKDQQYRERSAFFLVLLLLLFRTSDFVFCHQIRTPCRYIQKSPKQFGLSVYIKLVVLSLLRNGKDSCAGAHCCNTC